MSTETDVIKERLDIAEVVGEYVTLKRAGGHYKGLCPFHHEKSPSFIVSPDKGIWHCFGCGEGGDIFSFIQRVEGLDFPGALKMLAERAGVELKKVNPVHRDRRTRLYELLGLAARFYHEILMRQPAGEKAKKYLFERGIKEETMSQFMIGYSLQNWDVTRRYLENKGFLQEDMIAAGLVGRTERGKLFDRFRGRIMFPVHDVQGRVVAFGGRITPWHATGEEGKYINSPETEIYEKRRTVYNLYRAKKHLHHRQPCLVVEGYMDVAMLVQSGIENVVATSGTAFTAEHVQILRRYTDTLHFAFDSDAAGYHAAESATRAALLAGLRVATVLFPNGEDPADVAKRDTAEAKKCVETLTPLTDVLLQRLKEASDSNAREGLLDSILSFVSLASNVVQQGEMIQAISSTLHVPESVIAKRLASLPALPLRDSEQTVENRTQLDSPIRLSADQYLLGLLIVSASTRAELTIQLEEQFFLDSASNDLYKQIRHLATSQPRFMAMSADEVLSLLPSEHVAFAEGVRRVAEEQLSYLKDQPEREGRALLRALKQRWLERELREMYQQLNQTSMPDKAALERFQKIAEQLAALKTNVS